MSYSFDGTNDRLVGAFASTYASTPFTIAVFLKVTHPGAVDTYVNIGNNSASINDSLLMRTQGAANTYQAGSVDSTGTTSGAIVTDAIDGVWTGQVGVFTADNDRSIYSGDSTTFDTNTTNRVVADALKYIIFGENLANGTDAAGLIAEVAVWNIALTTTEVDQYCGGTAASSIQSANLIGYWPLSASNTTQSNLGTDSDGDLTVTGATFSSDHPTISSGGTTLTPNPAGMSV